MKKIYTVETPEQLRELHALRPEGNRSIDSLVRVWRARRVLASANYQNPLPVNFAYVEFDTDGRRATVYKSIYGSVAPIGALPYNKALAYCRDHGLLLTYAVHGELESTLKQEG